MLNQLFFILYMLFLANLAAMEEIKKASPEYIAEQTQLPTAKHDDKFWKPEQAQECIEELLEKSYIFAKDKIISPEVAHLLINYIDFSFQYAHESCRQNVCIALGQTVKDVKLAAWTASSKNNLKNGLDEQATDCLQYINRRGDNIFQFVNALIHDMLKNKFDEQEINIRLNIERRKNSWKAKRVDSFNKIVASIIKKKVEKYPYIEELKKRLNIIES